MHIKLLNLNTWLLPPPFAVKNHKRLNLLMDLIRESDADIVNLQEVWLRSYIRILRTKQDYHLYHARHAFYNPTGLVTLTKKKADHFSIHYFLSRGFSMAEKVARKGYLKLKFELDGTKITVFNVHLYSSVIFPDIKIQKKQLRTVKYDASPLSILSGDLNMSLSLFRTLNKDHFSFDETEDTVTKDNPYHTRLNKGRPTDKVYDYVLVTPGSKNVNIKTKVLKEPIVSDHYALLSDIEIS